MIFYVVVRGGSGGGSGAVRGGSGAVRGGSGAVRGGSGGCCLRHFSIKMYEFVKHRMISYDFYDFPRFLCEFYDFQSSSYDF